MGQKLSGYVEDELHDTIEAIAEHHNIPKARVVEFLLREGVQAREMRLRIVQLEAKLDLIIDTFAEEANAKERINDRIEKAMTLPIPEGTTGVDLVDEPFAAFQSAGIRPDEWSGPDERTS